MNCRIPLFFPGKKMQVVGLMSGSGTNLRKIIEHELKLVAEKGASPFHVSVIFSDSVESNAAVIGREYDLPVVVRDKKGFYKKRGKPLRDMEVRAEFDRENVSVLRHYNTDVAAYAGYMSIASPVLVRAFLGVNVHPAELTILGADGKPVFTGDNAVRDAIMAGEKELRSSTHIINERVDEGGVLMVSQSVPVELPPNWNPFDKDLVKRVSDEHQSRLKERGDWEIFPRTLQYIAEGRYSRDEKGSLYFDGEPIPRGVRL